jgi:hypothetical protein
MGRVKGAGDSDGADWGAGLGSEVLDSVGADVVSSVFVDEDVLLDVVDVDRPVVEVVDVGEVFFSTTSNCDASLSHIAQSCGWEGSTSNRPTPSSQQPSR